MDSLPVLPGFKFTNPSQSNFHRSHSLSYKNGYSQATLPTHGIGGQPINYNQLSDSELDALAHYNPTLTYGQAKPAPPAAFVPSHVVWDKKVLKFSAWYQQTVNESPAEHYRVRHVNLYYYLEDDSIAVNEPQIENSGLPQGRLIKRQRLPKNDVGDHYTWKDLNNGVNVTFYGKIFHIYDCDRWTRDFLESEGVEVNPPESCPVDPYVSKRQTSATLKTYKTPSDFDKLKQFVEMDRKVLRFYSIWDDRDNMFGELRKFIIHYYLVDDTLEVREMHTANNGHDPFPLLINRHRVPKNRYEVKSTFPAITLELSPQEINQYFGPADFGIGKTVDIYNRRFFIYDIDNFTKAFYWKTFGHTDFTPVDVELQRNKLARMDIAPYTGPGAVDDTMQSCLSLMPQPPKKDVVKMLGNEGRILRYEAILESDTAQENGRRFIISYRLNDDMLTIFEPATKNSGIVSGKFLERSRVCKPGSTPERPLFYGPQDFYIGATVEVFRRKFVIVNADLYVLTYMEEHPELFPASLVDNMRSRLQVQDRRAAARDNLLANTKYPPGDIERIVGEVKRHLKKLAITANNRIDKIFLDINIDRQGYVTKQNIYEVCARHYLPCDSAVIDRIACDICPSDPDHISLEELRRFLESP